jgi:glycosyltransferase involved in cell wall biosynthesis
MKVVHVIDSGGLYGAEIMLLSLIEEQKKLGIDVEVISIGAVNQPEKKLERELKTQKIITHVLRIPKVPSFSQGRRIFDICKTVKANVIHSHGYKGNILLGMWPRRLRKVPVVTTLHGYTKHKFLSKMTVNQIADKMFVRSLDAIVLVSPTINSQINLAGVKNKVVVIPNGVKEIISSDITFSNEITAPSDFVIGSIGRLCKEKNYLFLIGMMPHILLKQPNAKLIIYGEGEERGILESEINRLNLSEQVFLPGYLHNPHSFLQSIDLYVNCSLTEGMPITILEAMRARCLILASNILANQYLLGRSYKVKMLYDFSMDSFIECFSGIITASLAIQEDVKESLHALYASSFTSASMAKKYSQVYEKII